MQCFQVGKLWHPCRLVAGRWPLLAHTTRRRCLSDDSLDTVDHVILHIGGIHHFNCIVITSHFESYLECGPSLASYQPP